MTQENSQLLTELRERIRTLELRLHFLLGGGSVLAACILAFFAYEKWVDVPSRVQAEFANQIGVERLQVIQEGVDTARELIQHKKDLVPTLRFGDAVPWSVGQRRSPKIHTAPSAGLVVLSNGGQNVRSAVGSLECSAKNLRVRYTKDTPGDARANTHILFANRGDEFSVWGTETVRAHFYPLDLSMAP